jgi:chromosome partitioning protein
MRIMAVVNQKGGVGKTTTTCNLGAALARRGQRVLLVDLDAQAHLTFHLGIDNSQLEATSYDLLTGNEPLQKVVVKRSETLSVVPSHIDLAGAEIELVTAVAREQILREALASCRDQYDFVLIDCPPSLGLLTLNALVASDEILITLQPHFLALQGMTKLLETARLVRQRLNSSLRVTGLVFCMFDGRATLSTEVIADVEKYFSHAGNQVALLQGARVFKTRIRRNIKLAEAPGFGQTIFEYASTSHGAEDYTSLADELLEEPAAAVAATASTSEPAPAAPTGQAATTSAPTPAAPPAIPGDSTPAAANSPAVTPATAPAATTAALPASEEAAHDPTVA